ncbi:hypothetical protein ACXN5S_03845 [Pseudoroseicyclus sp. H15]
MTQNFGRWIWVIFLSATSMVGMPSIVMADVTAQAFACGNIVCVRFTNYSGQRYSCRVYYAYDGTLATGNRAWGESTSINGHFYNNPVIVSNNRTFNLTPRPGDYWRSFGVTWFEYTCYPS